VQVVNTITAASALSCGRHRRQLLRQNFRLTTPALHRSGRSDQRRSRRRSADDDQGSARAAERRTPAAVGRRRRGRQHRGGNVRRDEAVKRIALDIDHAQIALPELNGAPGVADTHVSLNVVERQCFARHQLCGGSAERQTGYCHGARRRECRSTTTSMRCGGHGCASLPRLPSTLRHCAQFGQSTGYWIASMEAARALAVSHLSSRCSRDQMSEMIC
jgi:hypothetical protein